MSSRRVKQKISERSPDSDKENIRPTKSKRISRSKKVATDKEVPTKQPTKKVLKKEVRWNS
jgi:hypothetical protein